MASAGTITVEFDKRDSKKIQMLSELLDKSTIEIIRMLSDAEVEEVKPPVDTGAIRPSSLSKKLLPPPIVAWVGNQPYGCVYLDTN